MFYRRKVLLALLQLFDNELDKLRLQKLLFLFTERQSKPEYNFVPFRFGCFSHSANADLIAMVLKGLVSEGAGSFLKIDKNDYMNQLKSKDSILLHEVKMQFGCLSAADLFKHIYINFPYYATKSENIDSVITGNDLLRVHKEVSVNNETILFTIGYEGISVEEFYNRLIKNDVKVLVDVRKTPLSMKYGFSKYELQNFCANFDIDYMHIPEVGIGKEQRVELNTQFDYDRLFTIYKKDILSRTFKLQNDIFDLLKRRKRIALTCFEANICRCHRKHLAEAIKNLPDFTYSVKHL